MHSVVILTIIDKASPRLLKEVEFDGVKYLTWGRPDARGFFSIGFLVLALLAGGTLEESPKATLASSGPDFTGLFHSKAEQHTIRKPVVAEQFNRPVRAGIPVPVSGTTPLIQAPLIAPETTDLAQQAPPAAPEITFSATMIGLVTHYGVSYHGQAMGCDGTPYDTNNDTIIAVGPDHYYEWPCGTELMVCGLAECLIGVRQDACPGCGPGHLDLSEAGIARVCGPGSGYCRVTIQTVHMR